MKKLLIAVLLMASTQSIASSPTQQQCNDALTQVAFINAFDMNCSFGGGGSLNLNLRVLQMQGCHDKLSLNDIRQKIGEVMEAVNQHRYEQNNPAFCADKELTKMYITAWNNWLKFENRRN